MRIALAGVNHKTAPVELRERLALSAPRLPEATARVRSELGAEECVFLATCNRVEVYVHAPYERVAGGGLERALADLHQLGADLPPDFLYVRYDDEAVRHLLRVAASLDSLAVGETQITGQVRAAYEAAREIGATGKALNRLFQQALHTAKHVWTETDVGRGQTSISSLAVQLAERVFETLLGKRVLLVGAGEMGELALKCFVDRGAECVTVVNRTRERAEELARRYGGLAAGLDELTDRLAESDVVVSATSATGSVITREQVAEALRRRRRVPIVLIDIGAPRNIEPEAGSLEGAYLYNIDDLQAVVEENVAHRDRALAECEAIIARETETFMRWYEATHAGPTIAELRESAEAMKRAELDRLFRRMGPVDEAARRSIEHMADRLVNQVLHPQLTAVREASRGGRDGGGGIAWIRRLFGMEGRG